MISSTRLVNLHDSVGALIDRLFPPHQGYKDEQSYWENFWAERLAAAEQTGHIFEHDVPGKRWLYERVIDAVEHCAGGSLAGMVVAEYGSGSGYATIRMAERGASPVIIDISETALRYARHIAARFGVADRVTFLRSDLLDGNVEAGRFDVCFNSGVLEHYQMDVAAEMLRQMARATKPGGVVATILPNLLAPVLVSRMVRSRAKGSERFYTPWLLGRLYTQVGLVNSRAGYVNAMLPVEAPLGVLEATRRARVERWVGPLSALFYRWAKVPSSNGVG
jgi:2-polyprenyl-3-methyl-5-hydroxy-6-metoxy-1,4-benzoquinol methylase